MYLTQVQFPAPTSGSLQMPTIPTQRGSNASGLQRHVYAHTPTPKCTGEKKKTTTGKRDFLLLGGGLNINRKFTVYDTILKAITLIISQNAMSWSPPPLNFLNIQHEHFRTLEKVKYALLLRSKSLAVAITMVLDKYTQAMKVFYVVSLSMLSTVSNI